MEPTVAVNNIETSTDEELAPLPLFTAPLLFPGATVGAGAPLSKVKPVCAVEVEVDVEETVVAVEGKGRLGYVPDEDKIGAEDPTVGAFAGVPDKEAAVGKRAAPVEETVGQGTAEMVTVVTTVTVGSPSVPIAV